MKYSADFKQIARDSLRGNWKAAALTGFVASLVGGTLYGGASEAISLNSDLLNGMPDVPSELQNASLIEEFYRILLLWMLFSFIFSIVRFFICGAFKLGYAKFNLNLIEGEPAKISDLFSQFNRFGEGLCMNFMVGLYLYLWSLLFIIPGIVKRYSYSMTPYILLENPEMSVDQAITESRKIMDGNKGKLFCLELSFIGWDILFALPAGIIIWLIYIGSINMILGLVACAVLVFIAQLFLLPYKEAAQAAFYHEIVYIRNPYDTTYKPVN